MNLSNIVIVLDHPDEPRNIGAALIQSIEASSIQPNQ